mmetsp:Transcript_72784/g.115611  ORF Transcript_72784/g.115611 Transcript_72784/m.115611 type:complete len:121 (-) Transcript_72784:86-448(-)
MLKPDFQLTRTGNLDLLDVIILGRCDEALTLSKAPGVISTGEKQNASERIGRGQKHNQSRLQGIHGSRSAVAKRPCWSFGHEILCFYLLSLPTDGSMYLPIPQHDKDLLIKFRVRALAVE